MNLADITTKCYILALIIRDDGERLLLGDGAYEFKDSQQHFIANTYANDVVELQGTDGQMLAGQVRRTATQTFAGYIGDATFSKQAVESARRDFLMFFRKKHYYTAVYVFSDGTAIQRDRGYIVNAPSVPELYQRFPEWSVGLNFEDPNYYEYAEDDLGHEIAAHKVELELSTAMSGGLIWDGDGAVSDDLSYVGTEIPGEGKNFQLADTGTATLKSAELLGDAEQDGTPTPDAPAAVNAVTGEQTVKIEGKNLFKTNRTQGVPSNTAQPNTTKRLFDFDEYVVGITMNNYYSPTLVTAQSVGSDVISVETSNTGYGLGFPIRVLPSTNYTISFTTNGTNNDIIRASFYTADGSLISWDTGSNTQTEYRFTTPANCDFAVIVFRPRANTPTTYSNIMLVEGSTAESFEPYQGQEFEIFLPPDTLDYMIEQGGFTNQGLNTVEPNRIRTKYYIPVEPNTQYTMSVASWNTSIGNGLPQFSVSYYSTDDYATPRLSNKDWTAFSTPATFTTPANCHFVRVLFNIGGYLPITPADMSGIRIRGGNLSTPIELAKIGNYQDRIYKDDGKWYIEKQVGKVVFNGTENWTLGYTGTPNFMYVISNVGGDAEPSSGQISRLLKSNYGTDGNVGATNTDEGILIIVSTAQLRVRYGSELSIDAWKAKLASNNMILYYALATPTTTEITNSELVGQLERLKHAHTYADTTNFSITATSPNLPAFLKVVAFGDDANPQGGYVWEDGGAGGATTITVDGVDNAQPIWTVVGPATNPSLTNITTGESIQWTGVVPNGQTLVVNMADMTASLSGANVFEFISGSWITLQAGNNRVSYSATAATGIATLEWNGVVG